MSSTDHTDIPPIGTAERRLLEQARSFADKHGLDPLDVFQFFVDLAWIRRGREVLRAEQQAASATN